MSDSIWSDGGRIQMPQYEKLTRIKKVDVTIVGGGLHRLHRSMALYTADCWKLWGKRKPACTLKRMNSHCVSIGNWQHL